MKFLFVTLTALLSLFSTKSHAGDVKVTPVVLESFNNSFNTATEVKWSANDKFYKADFSYNSQYVTAYFDFEGEVIAVTKNIASTQLPITLQTALKNDYKNLWVSDLFELTDDNGTSYYVTLEDADTKLVLKSSAASGWNVYQKQRKS